MFVVIVSPECAPAIKVGGLGDVIHGLARELEIRGNAVEIILPKYDCVRHEHLWGLTKSYSGLAVPFYDQWVYCDVWFAFVDGLKCFFIEPHFHRNFFNRGTVYGNGDDPERFAFFSRAALEFMLKSNKHPDVIHCHDWQTSLVPVLLYEMYSRLGITRPRACLTLHNVGHQGVVGEHILRQVGLNPAPLMNRDRLADEQYPHAANLMKGGIVFSNFVNTVSPRYAWEVQNTHLGMGLQRILNVHHRKFGGVLNGIDSRVWNPELDPHIPVRYSLETLHDKFKNKEALRLRLWLRESFSPIIAVVSRLDHQKGVDLIARAVDYVLQNGCQFVLLGSSPDPAVAHRFAQLKGRYNDHPDCHLELGFSDELAHLIYAGADMLLVPSLYEPCGLTQMIAMRYGTVPIVRNTGGLADTVFDADYAHKPYHERNGYVFNDFDLPGLESALRRAIGLWRDYPMYFHQLMENGMRYDFSWNHPGRNYVNIYNYIKA